MSGLESWGKLLGSTLLFNQVQRTLFSRLRCDIIFPVVDVSYWSPNKAQRALLVGLCLPSLNTLRMPVQKLRDKCFTAENIELFFQASH